MLADTGYKAQRPVRRGKTYDVIVGYKSTDKYDIVSADTGDVFTSVITAKSSISIGLEVREPTDKLSTEADIKKRELQAEGAILLTEYNKKLDEMKNNEAFIQSVASFSMEDSSLRQYYLGSGDNASAEKWSAMDNFERYSVNELYVQPKMSIVTSKSPITGKEFYLTKGFGIALERKLLIQKDAEKGLAMANAMEAILSWNWDNWHDHKIFIDLWEEFSEETDKTIPAIISTSSETKPDITEKAVTTTITVPPDAEKQPNKYLVILQNFGTLFADNIFSVVLIVLFGTAFLIARYISKKRKNADDDEDSLT